MKCFCPSKSTRGSSKVFAIRTSSFHSSWEPRRSWWNCTHLMSMRENYGCVLFSWLCSPKIWKSNSIFSILKTRVARSMKDRPSSWWKITKFRQSELKRIKSWLVIRRKYWLSMKFHCKKFWIKYNLKTRKSF